MGNAVGKKAIKRVMINPSKDIFYTQPYNVLEKVVLNCCDMQENENKFYIGEVHVSQMGCRFYCNYGRVGTNGQQGAKPFENVDLATKEFNKKLREKLKGGYAKVDMVSTSKGSTVGKQQINTKALGGVTPKSVIKTNLHPEVERLLTQIYDEAGKAISVSATGSSKMSSSNPLGNLGIRGINEGRQVLDRIARIIKSGRTLISSQVEQELIDASVYYYKIIPRKLPSNLKKDTSWLINTMSKLSNELDVLDLYESSLSNLSIMGVSDIDSKYRALNSDIAYVTDAKELEYISQKIANSHAPNHSIRAKVKSAYRVNQHNAPQFDARCGNVRNLFHGSRSANIVGILSSSLKLPSSLGSNIVKTGAMFGAGIYFASDCTKSLQYSLNRFNNSRNKYSTAYLFICEVALGKPAILTSSSSSLRQAPAGYHSVMGVGERTLKNMIARGEQVPSSSTSLINNEFIVYNESQQRIRYIVEVEV